MSGDAGNPPAPDNRDESASSGEVTVPEPVWQRIVALTATVMPAIAPDDLPRSLRRFAKFAPAKRAKLAAGALRGVLARDPVFRQRVADLVGQGAASLVAALQDGADVDDSELIDLAALAFLRRDDGWQDVIDRAAEYERGQSAAQGVEEATAQAQARITAAEHDRAVAEREAEKLRVELTELRAEVEQLRRQHRAATTETRKIKNRERKAAEMLSAERGRLKRAETEHEAETRQLKSQLDEARQALERARRGARDTRSLNEARLWLLLETISGAATGLRRELSLEPAERSPAEIVAEVESLTAEAARARARALDEDDPARLDDLLALPQAHMIVDGYNVTIGGYGGMTLEQQRARLVRNLSGIAAQTGSEVTVVFDGADRRVPQSPPARGVRVLFSRKGQTADDVIRALVRAEPNGRPVIVISSDREVADGTRRHGAYPLPSQALLRRMERQ